jgi:hypothetical protein
VDYLDVINQTKLSAILGDVETGASGWTVTNHDNAEDTKNYTTSDTVTDEFLDAWNGKTIDVTAYTAPKQTTTSGGSSATTYTITINTAENGTVRTSRSNASSGTSITVTATPNDGYEVNEVTVVDASNKSVSVKAASSGSYTFTMPSSNVTVTVTFKAASATTTTGTPVSGFTDVSSTDYFADAVAWAVEQGITTGTSTTSFSPNATCTRADMMTFLWRAAGSPDASANITFSDVSADAYYAKAVSWAIANGITSGTGDGKFSPNATISRAEAIQFLYRASNGTSNGGSTFSDVAANAYYANAVAWAVANGITSGTGNNTFSPNANCVRAQIVQFLYKEYANK